MFRLKHIIISVLMILTLGGIAEAQSTMRYPYEGITHNYTCDGISVGADYRFYITANSDGSGIYDDGLTGEFDIFNSSGVVGEDGLAATDIKWNIGASANIYYLWLEVTIPGGCSNSINLRITPQVNGFDMLSQNVPVTNTRSCPELDTDNGHNPSSTAYNAGSTQLLFRVVRENGTDNKLTATAGDTYDWSFVPVLNIDPVELALGKVIISIAGTNSGVITPVAGRYNVNGLDSEVLVTVSIQNAPGYTLNVEFGVSEQREENSNLSDGDPTNDTVIHTIDVIPVIGGMGGV